MQKPIRSSKIILTFFGVLFTFIALLIFFLMYQKTKQTWLLIVIATFILLAIGAFITLTHLSKDEKRFDKKFYPVSQGRGTGKVQSIAKKLEERLEGTFFLVESNEEGFRVLEGLDEYDEEQMAKGKFGIAEGFTFLTTSKANVFKEIAMDLNVWMEDQEVHQEPIYIGGRKINLQSVAEIERDEKGHLQISKEEDYTAQLAKILDQSKKEDGWSSSLDAVSVYGLIMGVLGIAGPIIAIVIILVQKFF